MGSLTFFRLYGAYQWAYARANNVTHRPVYIYAWMNMRGTKMYTATDIKPEGEDFITFATVYPSETGGTSDGSDGRDTEQ